LIFEIQQNSDTTYRVFDWNRVGLDGKPRDLHVTPSLASIDFNDFEPALVDSTPEADGKIRRRALVKDALFETDLLEMPAGTAYRLPPRKLQILAVTSGAAHIQSGAASVSLSAGQFTLSPASLERTEILASSEAVLLCVRAG
jgi:mannose-6-phosphate isomerase